MTIDTTLNLTAICDTASRIARDAGAVLMGYFGNTNHATTKSSAYDMVTEADPEAEHLIVQALTTAFPDHHILGEEGGGAGAPEAEATFIWHVDPLDGTTNFANGIPMFAVSLALADRELRPMVGVVYNPVSEELYTAVQGGGTRLNGRPLHVSQTTELGKSVVGSGFPYDKWTSSENNGREWVTVMTRSRGVRRMGSAALDCCYVAGGRFDGYWEQKLNTWDVLAGILCVLEAGGQVTNYEGDESSARYQEGRIVASNGHIHDALLEALAEARAGH